MRIAITSTSTSTTTANNNTAVSNETLFMLNVGSATQIHPLSKIWLFRRITCIHVGISNNVWIIDQIIYFILHTNKRLIHLSYFSRLMNFK